MAFDAELLESMAEPGSVPVLHLYDWAVPSATYGYFTDPAALLCMEAVHDAGLQLARRPTGGGVIFHLTDWAFSLAIPATHPAYSVNTLDNYAYVNRLLMRVVTRFMETQPSLSLLPGEPEPANEYARYFCMAKPTKYDVMLEGRKVAGGAQRRTRFGFLHQGSISLAPPDIALLSKVLLPNTGVLQAMQQHTGILLPDSSSSDQIASARRSLADLLVQAMQTSVLFPEYFFRNS